jgi:hypothetical protein
MNLPPFMKKNLDIYLRNYMRHKASTCKICNGTLIVEGETDVKNCPECIDKTLPKRVFVYANIGNEYLDIEVSDVKETFAKECYAGFKEIVDNVSDIFGKANLLICRNDDNHSYGTSTVAMLIAKALIVKGFEGYVVPASSLVDYFFGFGDSSTDTNKKEMLDYITAIPVLIINDVGQQFKKSSGKDYLYTTFVSFLGRRKMNGKMTIITTEHTLRGFEDDHAGVLSNIIKDSFVPFVVKCHYGKLKQTSEEKFKRLFGNKMPSMAKYLSGADKEPERKVSDIIDDKKPLPKNFVGTSYRKDQDK